jgi:TRAP transporter 4TM/12TM fusion protein
MLAYFESLLPAAPHGGAAERRTAAFAVAVLAIATTALVLYNAYTGAMTALVVRSLFFSGLSAAGLVIAALRSRFLAVRGAIYLLALVALVPGPYLYQNFVTIISMGGLATPVDEVLFIVTLTVLLLLVYFHVGWVLVVLVLTALAYAVYGDFVPGRYGHGGYGLDRLASTLFLSTEGIYGIPMGVAVDYIFLFALFGTLLLRTGTGEVFVDLARALTGRAQGGPALSAVLSSSLMGTINGSAVANVVTTGTFTIPLMKRLGLSATTAGAVEAAASSAGQIIPPIMGAAAFLMAEIIGVPYAQIALAAAIPAGLYVLALLIAVRLEAGRLNLARDPSGRLSLLGPLLLRRGYLLLPLVLLIVLLVQGYTPMRAAVISIAAALLLTPWRKETRLGPLALVGVCIDALTVSVQIVAAIAAAGVVIGVLGLTGLGLMLSGLILELGGQNLLAVLLLTALASFVLGMGLPTSAAYLLLAVLVAPALVTMGLPDISAHMFIFYYGLLSAITPPVALAAYAAAGISGADSNATAFEAIRLGFVKVLVPFMFVTMPGLLMIGDACVDPVQFACSPVWASPDSRLRICGLARRGARHRAAAAVHRGERARAVARAGGSRRGELGRARGGARGRLPRSPCWRCAAVQEPAPPNSCRSNPIFKKALRDGGF